MRYWIWSLQGTRLSNARIVSVEMILYDKLSAARLQWVRISSSQSSHRYDATHWHVFLSMTDDDKSGIRIHVPDFDPSVPVGNIFLMIILSLLLFRISTVSSYLYPVDKLSLVTQITVLPISVWAV